MKKGFTAVELLIALFIAALFILGGYQLYGTVALRLGNARETAQASNVGYSILRNQGSVHQLITNNCTNPAIENVDPATVTGLTNLPNATATIRRCRPVAASTMIRVLVTVQYGSTTPLKEVIHVTYVNP